MSATEHGDYFWFVALAPKGSVTFFADRVETRDGSMIAIGHTPHKEREQVLLVIPINKIQYCYAASVLTGTPIAADSWETT